MALTLRPGMMRIWPLRINISSRLTVSSVSVKLWIFSFILWSRTQKSGLSFIDGPSRANFAVSRRKRDSAVPHEKCPSIISVFAWIGAFWLAAILVTTALIFLLWVL